MFYPFFFQEPSDSSEQLAEEEVARLSGELQWLREETRHGDRKLEELQDQVILIPGDTFGYGSRLASLFFYSASQANNQGLSHTHTQPP